VLWFRLNLSTVGKVALLVYVNVVVFVPVVDADLDWQTGAFVVDLERSESSDRWDGVTGDWRGYKRKLCTRVETHKGREDEPEAKVGNKDVSE